MAWEKRALKIATSNPEDNAVIDRFRSIAEETGTTAGKLGLSIIKAFLAGYEDERRNRNISGRLANCGEAERG